MSIFSHSPVAILSGAGKAGRPLVRAVLEAGYPVRVLLRNPEQFDLLNPNLEILQGDARDPVALQRLLHDCSTLLSTLGQPRGETVPIIGTVARHLLAVMRGCGVSRYVVVTTLYDTAHPQHDEPTRLASEYMHQHFPQMMADRQLEFQLLQESDLAWTYIRLPLILDEPPTGSVKVNLEYLPGQSIITADLAQFMIDQLTSDQYMRQAPFVASS